MKSVSFAVLLVAFLGACGGEVGPQEMDALSVEDVGESLEALSTSYDITPVGDVFSNFRVEGGPTDYVWSGFPNPFDDGFIDSQDTLTGGFGQCPLSGKINTFDMYVVQNRGDTASHPKAKPYNSGVSYYCISPSPMKIRRKSIMHPAHAGYGSCSSDPVMKQYRFLYVKMTYTAGGGTEFWVQFS